MTPIHTVREVRVARHAHPVPSRRLVWIRALGEAAAFLFVLGTFTFLAWMVTP